MKNSNISLIALKVKYIVLFLLIIAIDSLPLSSQTRVTRYTPLSSPVTAYSKMPSMSSKDKNDWSSYVSKYFPNAKEINKPSATSNYNCHGHAWHVSDGGDQVWIGLSGYDPNPFIMEDIYWKDGSFIRLKSEIDANKISYYNGNHSAIQTSTTGTYHSKWGNGPLMEHSRDYGPADYQMSYRYYYDKPEISGTNSICYPSTQSFSVQDFHNVAYSWSTSSNLQIDGSNTSRYVSISPKSSSSSSGYLQLSIYIPDHNQTIVITKNVWIGNPGIPTGIIGFCCNGMEFGSESIYEFTANHATNQGVNQYNWVVAGGTILEGQGTKTITVQTSKVTGSQNKYFDVSIRVGNSCGWSNYLWRSGFVSSGIGPARFSVYPNPAISEITISVSDAQMLSETIAPTEISAIGDVKIFDSFGTLKKTTASIANQKSITLNVSDLQKGTYLIIINSDTIRETHKLIID
jgi:hypothetical protein